MRSKVFKWSRKSEWRKTFLELTRDFITEDVLDELKKVVKSRFSIEDITWLNQIISKTQTPRTDVQIILAQRLQQNYDFAIAFHGCRPNSLESYKEQGLRPSDPGDLKRIAAEIFGDTPRLHEIFEELHSRYGGYEQYNYKKVFFSLTKEKLMCEWKAYLLEGSEFLAAIAQRLNALDKLTDYGKPVIVECLIPCDQLDFSFWKAIAACEIEDALNRILFPSVKFRQQISAGFHILSAISPERLKFHFPNEVVVETKFRDFETNEIQTHVERKLLFNRIGANLPSVLVRG